MPEEVMAALLKATSEKSGHPKLVITRSAGPSSYATGGFDVVIGELSQVLNAVPVASNGYSAEIDWDNSSGNRLKVKVYSAAGTEVTAGTNLESVYITILTVGR